MSVETPVRPRSSSPKLETHTVKEDGTRTMAPWFRRVLRLGTAPVVSVLGSGDAHSVARFIYSVCGAKVDLAGRDDPHNFVQIPVAHAAPDASVITLRVAGRCDHAIFDTTIKVTVEELRELHQR
jgi:hypothetical protein